MSDEVVIKVENLSKRYTLHHLQPKAQGLRHVLEDTVSGPWRALSGYFRSQKSDVCPPTSDLRPPTSDLSPPPSDEDFWALKDVSFEVKRGEVLGIIGRNGAGKSTLLKILSRITEPTTGRIEIEGRVASLLEVGTGFHQELTGRENIFLNGAILGMSRAEIRNRFDEIVAFSEVEKFLDTPVKRYSSGMYVRLAFAVAAHLEPEILIVDEVLAVGDSEFQAKCLGRMRDVATNGRTVLFVSHNLPALMSMCDSALLLDAGTLLAGGTVRDTVQLYMSNRERAPSFRRKAKSSSHNREVSVANVSIEPIQPSIGEKVRFQVEILRSHLLPTRTEVEVSFGIVSSLGIKVIQLYSRHSNRSFHLNNETTTITATIDCLLLVPDTYTLSIWIGNGKETLDFVEECLDIPIAPGRICPTGPFVEERGYPVILKCEWENTAAPSG